MHPRAAASAGGSLREYHRGLLQRRDATSFLSTLPRELIDLLDRYLAATWWEDCHGPRSVVRIAPAPRLVTIPLPRPERGTRIGRTLVSVLAGVGESSHLLVAYIVGRPSATPGLGPDPRDLCLAVVDPFEARVLGAATIANVVDAEHRCWDWRIECGHGVVYVAWVDSGTRVFLHSFDAPHLRPIATRSVPMPASVSLSSTDVPPPFRTDLHPSSDAAGDEIVAIRFPWTRNWHWHDRWLQPLRRHWPVRCAGVPGPRFFHYTPIGAWSLPTLVGSEPASWGRWAPDGPCLQRHRESGCYEATCAACLLDLAPVPATAGRNAGGAVLPSMQRVHLCVSRVFDPNPTQELDSFDPDNWPVRSVTMHHISFRANASGEARPVQSEAWRWDAATLTRPWPCHIVQVTLMPDRRTSAAVLRDGWVVPAEEHRMSVIVGREDDDGEESQGRIRFQRVVYGPDKRATIAGPRGIILAEVGYDDNDPVALLAHSEQCAFVSHWPRPTGDVESATQPFVLEMHDAETWFPQDE